MQKNSTVYDLIFKIMRITGVQLMVAILFSGMAIAHDNHAQEILNRPVSLQLNQVSLEEALTKIEAEAKVKFGYSRNKLNLDEKVTVEVSEKKLGEVLDALLAPRSIKYIVQDGEDYIILTEKNLNDPQTDPVVSTQDVRIPVSGTIKDANGTPMPGVSVVVKGTGRGTTTDSEGKYTIDVEEGETLVFSFIGYKSVEQQLNGRTVIDLTLEDDTATLGEVIINANYYNVKDREQTGNIRKIEAKDIEKQPVQNPLQALQARVPGLEITQLSGVPGGNFKIRIRGTNSISSGNDPLFIVDGVPFTSTSMTDFNSSGQVYNGGSSPLNTINPSDIESIEVLKDAGATAIYGSRGANGVILITTKKGKAGKTKIDINYYTGVGKVTRKMDLLSTKDYLTMRHEAFENDGVTPDASNARDLVQWDTTRYRLARKVDWGYGQNK